MNDGDILMTMTIELELAKEDYKKLLYTRATHSCHTIQYHMQQIIEHQKVVNEYSNMMEEGRDLTPLESNLYKSDPAVISHLIYMIEVDKFWCRKTFEAVLADLQRNWDKQAYKQENKTLHCTENTKIYEEMDEKEVIDLCDESQTMTSDHWKAEQIRDKKTMTQRRAKQSQERRMKTGLKRTFKCKRLTEMK